MNVYFISGLGADCRVFNNIRLPLGHEAVHLHWIKPFKNEFLRDYALRLAQGIDQTKPYVLVGLSMGGMIATEIANHLNPVFTILISSVPLSAQLPRYFRIGGRFRLYRLVPPRVLSSGMILKRFFVVKSKKDKILLQDMLRDMDPEFIRWAIHAVATWSNSQLPPEYAHIHGAWDRILPVRFCKPTEILRKAGHLMVVNRAAEVNIFIEKVFLAIKKSASKVHQ